MKTQKILSAVILGIALTFGLSSNAQKTVMVGGAPMYPTKNIIENAVNSKDHTTLVAAVKAGELVNVLSGKGPFTVFAPTNAAFEKLPAGTVETLLKPENKATLQAVLTYHVVSGNMDSKAIAKAIKEGNGKATLTTVQGGKLTCWMDGKNLIIKDEKGGKSMVTIANVYQSNGVIHVVDSVVLPN
ncbi:fasciclin domain-containing protein [Flavobacterium amniphilum]|uniref:fasciclin domain-containing protein n=1 Tax=Flavobacterium amniphilum TaxID=1834035 RepID=UPI002029E352|nr:fasciclin domain-containing protein [Flavobacterium amniphilum]MCL9805281.1 fasciclin domain-containing protein [Flavobacterium amniphilum]